MPRPLSPFGDDEVDFVRPCDACSGTMALCGFGSTADRCGESYVCTECGARTLVMKTGIEQYLTGERVPWVPAGI